MLSNTLKFYTRTLAISTMLLVGSNLTIGDNLRSQSSSQAVAESYLAQSDDNAEEIEAIQTLIQQNLQDSSNEDLEAVMNAIHPDSPERANTRQISEQVFGAYELEYTADNVEVLQVSDSEASVRIVQTTKKVSGAEFRDNVTTAIHTLKKHNGEWKFFNVSKIENIEYL